MKDQKQVVVYLEPWLKLALPNSRKEPWTSTWNAVYLPTVIFYMQQTSFPLCFLPLYIWCVLSDITKSGGQWQCYQSHLFSISFTLVSVSNSMQIEWSCCSVLFPDCKKKLISSWLFICQCLKLQCASYHWPAKGAKLHIHLSVRVPSLLIRPGADKYLWRLQSRLTWQWMLIVPFPTESKSHTLVGYNVFLFWVMRVYGKGLTLNQF